MRGLIAGLLELAQGGAQTEKEEFQLDEVVEDVVERARTRFPDVSWQTDGLEPTVVDGYRDRMERAVWNLLENAGKWSGDGGSVEVSLAGGELQVRDHGPGFADEAVPSSSALLPLGGGAVDARRRSRPHDRLVAEATAADDRRECRGGGAVVRLSATVQLASALRVLSRSGSICVASNSSLSSPASAGAASPVGVFPDPLR
jgi:hypothetical protein